MELSRKIRDGFPAFCAYNHLKDITDEINEIRYFISYIFKIIFLYEFINYKCAILLSGTGKEA